MPEVRQEHPLLEIISKLIIITSPNSPSEGYHRWQGLRKVGVRYKIVQV